MIKYLYDICQFCLFDGFYLFYALFVFAVSVLAANANSSTTSQRQSEQGRLPPIPGGELRLVIARVPPPDKSIVTKTFELALSLASFSFFLPIVRFAVQFIRTIFLMRDNPTPIRSFLRYFYVYYLAILLPAAFMPPVSHPQRQPDFQLMAAVVLLICVNALGDVISVRIFLGIFNRFDPDKYKTLKQDADWVGLRNEVSYYLAVLFGGFCCLGVLACVLICSSIFYGVQIGQMDFGLTESFFHNAWERAVRFPELATTLFWFRDQPGPFGWAGVPGMFIYGLTTFLPMIILSCLALLWLFLIPFRVAVNLPLTISPVVRVISAEAAVFAMCLVTRIFLSRVSSF